jgi:hypothetical protein
MLAGHARMPVRRHTDGRAADQELHAERDDLRAVARPGDAANARGIGNCAQTRAARLPGGLRPVLLSWCRTASRQRARDLEHSGGPSGLGAKLGSHPAKGLTESGEVRKVICPARRQSRTLADSPGLGSELICKQGVRGSSPLSSTRQNTQNKISSRAGRARHMPVPVSGVVPSCPLLPCLRCSWASSLTAVARAR